MVKNAEEANILIAEKARVSEKEALELSKRASKAEAEVQRIKLSQLKVLCKVVYCLTHPFSRQGRRK